MDFQLSNAVSHVFLRGLVISEINFEICHEIEKKRDRKLAGGKTSKNLTETLTKICATFFPHESLLNLWPFKSSQNSTEFFSEICKQFSCINPY